MNSSRLFITALALNAFGCASDPRADSDESLVEKNGKAGSEAHEVIPGKYVDGERILMVYGRCSPENFLGDDIAKGAIRVDGTMRAEEGDLCLRYSLTPDEKDPTLVHVRWKADPTASAHRDPAIAEGCKSNEGDFSMMEASTYADPLPGAYVKSGSTEEVTLTVSRDCKTPTTLKAKEVIASSIAVPEFLPEGPMAVIRAEEGDVCSAYTLEQQESGAIKVTWLPPTGSVAKDPAVAKGCKSNEGLFVAPPVSTAGKF